MAAGEHEAVPAGPEGIGRVVLHDPLEQQVGGGCEAHRGTRVAVAGLLHGVHRENPDGVNRAAMSEQTRPGTVIGAYVSLTKPRIVELLLVTTVPAMFLAQRRFSPLWLTLVVLVGGALAAGAANALNCYIDRDIDQVMRRTARRPLPAHTLSPRAPLVFGLVLAGISLALMGAFTNS